MPILICMYITGVLHDVKATNKSIAAGGRDSITDAETGVSDINGEYLTNTRATLKAQVYIYIHIYIYKYICINIYIHIYIYI